MGRTHKYRTEGDSKKLVHVPCPTRKRCYPTSKPSEQHDPAHVSGYTNPRPREWGSGCHSSSPSFRRCKRDPKQRQQVTGEGRGKDKSLFDTYYSPRSPDINQAAATTGTQERRSSGGDCPRAWSSDPAASHPLVFGRGRASVPLLQGW